MKLNHIWIFLMGVATTLVILPLAKALGIPSYDLLLVTLFGENSI
ncbi:hypothetical protein [Bacillus sp. PS06]|nr:hypothetical protein [Bacillus sp. PS06]